MQLSRNEFFQLVAGGSAWLVSSGFAQKIKLAVADAARPLPLTAVRLTGGPLKQAQDLDAKYLLSLEPDRMLAFYRKLAGLAPKAEGYTGWDAEGRQLTGHIAGHYLSAVSLMFAATGDLRFKQRADYIVSELKEVQDRHGDGFAGALQGVKACFAEVSTGTIRAANFDLNGLWSPWYTLHKTYAGLRDAYRHTGNRQALQIEIKFAEWASTYLAPMHDETVQRMLATEFGGMNEMMADLYADTGDRRWLDLSYKFEHKAVMDPLKNGDDPLSSLHGNTQVPKAIGSAARYAYAGDRADRAAATTFWDRVVHHHTFATGGHGKDEYFREPDLLGNITEGRTAETCNVYNMLKLTRKLFALQPEIQYAEFHERALFNHILGSIDSADGSTCYMVPVGSAVRREYADMQRSFTCCVGTGMESHALHGLGLYYESGDKLYVNLYVPSTAHWEAAGVKLQMATGFPEGDTATMKLDLRAPRPFTLALRRPSWAGEGFSVRVNGQAVATLPNAGSYVEITRTWRSGDEIALAMPKALRLERLADNPRKGVVMWGPLVLAGDLGPAPRRREDGDGDGDGVRSAPPEPPSLVTERPITELLQPVPGKPGTFLAVGVARTVSGPYATDLEFRPFYGVHRRLYSAYWDVLTPSQFAGKVAEADAERQRQAGLQAATIAALTTIDPASERPFNQRGEESTIVRSDGRPGRRAAKWFSYDLPVDGTSAVSLVVTYNSDNRKPRTFDILVDNARIGNGIMPQTSVAKFYDVHYNVPPLVTNSRQSITVRFVATNGNETAPVFGIRTIRI
ncbi:MAG: beta-L-arabinofuranosidase domain-containing protein [Vicinamibacterales bacterium]